MTSRGDQDSGRHDGDVRPDAPPQGTVWRTIIRSERTRVGLTQAGLAARAGLSPETVRKYEAGTRQAPRESLERILDVLQVPVGTRHRVLLDRGFHHPDTRFPPDRAPHYYFTAEELQGFVDETPWPQFVANELGELIAVNRRMQALWGVDLAAEQARRSRTRTNLLVAMAEPRFFERIANWEEICRYFVALYKAVPAGRTMLDDPGPMFSEILSEFSSANPAALRVLFKLWQSTPKMTDKAHWLYPVIWREPGFPEINFRGVVSTASEPEGWGFNDWVPLDAASHATLEAVLASRSGHYTTR